MSINSSTDIKLSGVSAELPENPLYFRQMNITEILEIPIQKPDIERVLSVSVEIEVLSLKLIDTECSKSYEGQLLTGKKLTVELNIKEQISYIADHPEQPVHAAHYDEFKKCVFVVVPNKINDVGIERLLASNKLNVTPYIEDIYAKQKNKRIIYKNITLLIDVTTGC